MIRSPSFSFSLFIGIMSLLVMLAVGSNDDLCAEEEQQNYQLIQSISSSSHDKSDHDLYYGVAFIKGLENLIQNFEYTFDLGGNQIFPNNNIKRDIVSEYKASDYNIDDLNYDLWGFKIIASDIKIRVDPKRIDDTKTRIDIPLLLAKDIKVSNGGLINLSYDSVEIGSVYCIYDKVTDKMTVHVPISIASNIFNNNKSS